MKKNIFSKFIAFGLAIFCGIGTSLETLALEIKDTEPYWCNEGGSNHVIPVENMGWFNSYDEAQSAARSYLSAHGGGGNWYVDQCECGLWTSMGKPPTDKNSNLEHICQRTIVKPTCITQGYTLFSCTDDDANFKDNFVDAIGHKYVKTVVKATYFSQGYTLHKCSICKKSYKDKYTSKLTVPSVTGFKVASTTNNAVKLTWNKVSNANGYIVYKYDNTKKTWIRITKTKNASNTYTVSKLKAGTTYKFAVKAYKNVSGKEISSAKYPQLSTSTSPAKVSFKLTSDTKSATIKWNKVTGATGYKVYYKTSAKGKWTLLKTTNNKATSYKKSGLTPGKTYWFTVKAYRNANGKTYSGTYTTKSIKIKEIKAKSIKLNKSKISIQRGNSYSLKATINPKNTTDKITWTSSNKKIATVSSKGVVKGLKKGTATITAKVNGKKATCKVTITKRKTKSIKLSKSKATIISGNTLKLSRTVNPSNSEEGVTWSSSNPSVASIKIQGQTCIVTGKKNGTAIITAKSGSKKSTCKVTVTTSNQGCYYINHNSKKIHIAGCRTIKDESNYEKSNSYYSALAQGYDFCKVCF